MFARIGAVIFIAIAITMTAIEMARAPDVPRDAAPLARPDSQPDDPLRLELRRCQALGADGASDRDCLRAWAENRRRFLTPSARPAGAIADDRPHREN